MDATAIALASLIVSGANTIGGLGIAWWVAHRDRGQIQVHGTFATVSGPIPLMSPRMDIWDVGNKALFSIDVVNKGRRPVTIDGAGIKLRRRGLWRLLFWDGGRDRPDRLAFTTSPARLPITLSEQQKVDFFTDLEDLRTDLPRVVRSPHQIAGVYAQDVAGRQYVERLPRGIWRHLASAIRSSKLSESAE